MKKKIIIGSLIALLLISLIFVHVAVVLSNPLRRSAEKIKESILELTPIGTDIRDVTNVIKSNEKWKIEYTADGQDENGFISDNSKKTMRVFLGKYRGDFSGGENILDAIFDIIISRTHVTVFWGFDENSELIDVYVWKDMSGF